MWLNCLGIPSQWMQQSAITILDLKPFTAFTTMHKLFHGMHSLTFLSGRLLWPEQSLVLTVLYLEDWLCASQSLWRRDPEDCAPKWNLPHCCIMFSPSEKKKMRCVELSVTVNIPTVWNWLNPWQSHSRMHLLNTCGKHKMAMTHSNDRKWQKNIYI